MSFSPPPFSTLSTPTPSLSTPTLDPRFATRARQPGLDLLRALAVVFVILYHGGNFGITFPSRVDRFGWIGVDLFFVLSGYLIGGQLLAPLACGIPLDLPRFFYRRALRILPAYLAILTVYATLPTLREWPDLPPLWRFLTFVQNLDLHGGTAFSHAWSLCVEAQFYLVLPFLLPPLIRHPRAAFLLPAAVVLAGLALRAVLASTHPDPDGGVSGRAFQHLIYYPTWTRLDPLVCGVSLAAIERFRPSWWQRLAHHAPHLLLPALAAIGLGLYLGEGDALTLIACLWQFPLIALGMSLFLLCAVSPRLPLHRIPVPGAAYLASIAYSVYLSHKLVIHAIIRFCAAHNLAQTSAPALALNLVTVFLVGSILFFTIERPFLQLRRRTKPNLSLPPP